jgi:hypothetical protein
MDGITKQSLEDDYPNRVEGMSGVAKLVLLLGVSLWLVNFATTKGGDTIRKTLVNG